MDEKILEAIEVPPSTNLINVLANSGYSIESAISDIVDNSIAHGATNISINVERANDGSIEILDDGNGMNDLELQEAMRFAGKATYEARDENDLGRYGVGMKTASSAFCHILQVVSKGNDGLVNSYLFPFDSLEWKIYKIDVPNNSIPTPSGTKVIWHKLKLSSDFDENKRLLSGDSDSFSQICDKIGNHLSKIFGYFLRKGLKISLNGTPIEDWNPFYVPGLDVETCFSDFFVLKDGKKVIIKSFLLPNVSHMNDFQLKYASCWNSGELGDFAGFYIFRGNRLIVPGGWLGVPKMTSNEKYNYARIGIWFDASPETDEYFKVNFMKNSVVLPPDFEKYIANVAANLRSKSQKNFEYLNNARPYKRTVQKENEHIWNVTRKTYSRRITINREHPLIKTLTKDINKRRLDALFRLLETEYPANELCNAAPDVQMMSSSELESLLRSAVLDEMQTNGLSLEKAIKEVLKQIPFCEEKYKTESLALAVSFRSGDFYE